EAALRPGPLGLLWEVALQRIEHRITTEPIDLHQVPDVLTPAALPEVLADEVLAQGGRAQVRRLLAERDLLEHRRRSGHPTDSDAGGEDLRQGAEIEDVIAAIEAVERPLRLAVVAEQAVWVVLDDQHLVLACELDQAASPLLGERHPCGV